MKPPLPEYADEEDLEVFIKRMEEFRSVFLKHNPDVFNGLFDKIEPVYPYPFDHLKENKNGR